jgi:hypothetical protein
VSGFHTIGLLPDFRAAERSVSTGELGVSGWIDERLYLNARVDYHHERAENSNRHTSPGSLRLLTLATVLDGAVDVQTGWMASLPWTADHGEVLTDELDVWLLAGLSTDLGAGRVGMTGGLAILGNPLRFANQDDAPLLWLTGALPLKPVTLTGRLGGALATARNPARIEAILGAERGNPWRVGVTGTVGLTPAAGDLGAGVWLGHRWGCGSDSCD